MVEIAAAIAAVKAVSATVEASAELVGKIRSGWRDDNDKVRAELEAALEDLDGRLQSAGELAWVAAAYSRTRESIVGLLGSCKRAERFIRDNMDDLTDASSPQYEANWRLLDMMFEGIGEASEVPRKAVLDRAEWYDERDKDQIDLRLNDVVRAYTEAAKSVRTKAARDAQGELGDMIRPLEDVDTMLRDTLYDEVLRTLQQLKR
jgi:hypothetical protein